MTNDLINKFHMFSITLKNCVFVGKSILQIVSCGRKLGSSGAGHRNNTTVVVGVAK